MGGGSEEGGGEGGGRRGGRGKGDLISFHIISFL